MIKVSLGQPDKPPLQPMPLLTPYCIMLHLYGIIVFVDKFLFIQTH